MGQHLTEDQRFELRLQECGMWRSVGWRQPAEGAVFAHSALLEQREVQEARGKR